MILRERKSSFVSRFEPHEGCPGFWKLVLSNGCNFGCRYCYLRGTFRGTAGPGKPVGFTNDWNQVREQIEQQTPPGTILNTGELADSFSPRPPLLPDALDYFSAQEDRTLLLVTKASVAALESLRGRKPSPSIIVSFSVSGETTWKLWEESTPSPLERLKAARLLRQEGWRVRIRIDPITLLSQDSNSQRAGETAICLMATSPWERITVGALRPLPPVYAMLPKGLAADLTKQGERYRYPLDWRHEVFENIAKCLDFQPGLCKEPQETWNALGWTNDGRCNCTE